MIVIWKLEYENVNMTMEYHLHVSFILHINKKEMTFQVQTLANQGNSVRLDR